MKVRVIILILSVAVLAVILFFQLRGEKNDNLAPGVHRVKAKEVLQTSNYTYVRVSEGRKDYWCALNRAEIETGKTYYWLKGTEMTGFHSKELNRDFASIFFLEAFSDKPLVPETAVTGEYPMAGASMGGKQKIPEKQGIKAGKAEGGITISELYANRKSYQGKSVKIRGEVVKFSPHIMNKNWVHIQDGTKDGSDYDLAVTTLDSLTVGDTRVFEGVISLDVDFGYGYSYPVIMQDARAE
jgi:hypothetical protein